MPHPSLKTGPVKERAGALTRRGFVIGLPFALAACQSQRPSTSIASLAPPQFFGGGDVGYGYGGFDYASAYAPVNDNGFLLPAIRYQEFDPLYLRQYVSYPTQYDPGTIVVDPRSKFLYLIEPGGQAIRYGIGVGREGFSWSGEARVGYKRVWPKWFPPDEMIARQPELAKYDDGMDGGPANPIGARGLYLWQGNEDTLYRIHGTNQPESIGTNASSGCIRLWQQDIIDLYERVPLNAKVVVLA